MQFETDARPDSFPPGGHRLLHTAIHADSAEPSCLEQAEEWLQTCLRSHHLCATRKRRKVRPPTRLIDVMPQTESNNPCLCLATQNIVSWVALSYCWGGQSDFVLNDRTMGTMIEGIPLSDFPATLRDAIAITRRLGIRHLWIDALCIKQDSEDDWRRESARMRDVYKGATLTLVAANAPSVNTGIFSKRTPKLDLCRLPWSVPYSQGQLPPDQGESVCMRPHIWDQETEPWPIQQRGWTLQEFVLSSRTLSYTKCRMVWQCFTCHVDEGGRVHQDTVLTSRGALQNIMAKNEARTPLRVVKTVPRFVKGMYSKIELPRSLQQEPNRHWTTLVHEYTSRNLTKETDVLPGIAGLASELARQTRDSYLAGLWRQELLLGLMWSLDPFLVPKNNAPITNSAEYRAPSWSWASVKGSPIRIEPPAFSHPRTRDASERTKIIEAKVEPVVSRDPFGQVKGGYLILRGRFFSVGNFLRSDSTAASDLLPATRKVLRASVLEAPGMMHEFYQQHKPCDNQQFALLQLTAWIIQGGKDGADYLVLESVATDASIYRRIGFITLATQSGPIGNNTSPDDRLAMRGDGYGDLAKDALQELQEVKGAEKVVKII